MAARITPPAGEGAEQKDEVALRSAVQRAVSRKKTKTIPSDLAWIFQQCSTYESGAGGGDRTFFRLYEGIERVPWEMQTYQQWKSFNGFQRLAHPRRLRNMTITIVPIAYSNSSLKQIDPFVLRCMKDFCTVYFEGMDVEIGSPVYLAGVKQLTTRIHKDTRREQFLVGDILAVLKAHMPRQAYTVVGVTMVDLYPSPEWNFVLGHASLTNGCAVISFGRYFGDLATTGSVSTAQQLQNMWILLRVRDIAELCRLNACTDGADIRILHIQTVTARCCSD